MPRSVPPSTFDPPSSVRADSAPSEPSTPRRDRSRASIAVPSRTGPRADSSASAASRLLERALPIGILAVAIVGVPILVLQPEGMPRMRALERELADVNSENETLRRSVTELRSDVQRLRDDPAAVERIARDQLGLVRKSEIVFQFPRGK